MRKNMIGLLLTTGLLLLQGCGSTSGIKPVNDSITIDFSGYDRVVVLDFQDHTDKARLKEDRRNVYEERVDIATRTFADLVAAEIRGTGAYSDVLREAAAGPAILVTGAITRYQEGQAALRFFIGMGAGSSYFDADVKFADNLSEAPLAEVQVDKNSWALGGGIAAGQTVESFMQGAAKKIARELAAAKASTNGASDTPVGAAQ